jgi:hypothetical protein
MSSTVDNGRNALRGALARAAGFLGFWLILSGYTPADLVLGALAAVMAT